MSDAAADRAKLIDKAEHAIHERRVLGPWNDRDLATAAHSVMAGIAVDEPMVDRAMKAFGETEIVGTNFTRRAIRAALVAALAPPRHE